MNKKIHIAACFDKGYIMPTSVMIYSTCVNNPDVDINFHLVIDESVTGNDKKDLVETISPFKGKEVIFYIVDSHLYDKFPLINSKYITRATYYRIFLSEILPDSVDKIIYLDGDCIVRHSLMSLWNTDISEKAIAAVFDAFEGDPYHYHHLFYPPKLGYFNAGVLFINLNYWRRHHVINALMEYMSKYPERIIMEDQDLMNVVLRDVKISIHPKYNFQTDLLRCEPHFYYWGYEEEIKEAIADPVIIHFTSREKPWHTNIIIPHPYRSSFFKYQNQTKWKGDKINNFQFKKKIKKYIDSFLRLTKIRPPRMPFYIEVSPID